MSDSLSWQERLKVNYKVNLQGETSCLRYVNNQRSGNCVVLKISRKVLLKWRDLKLTISDISYEDFGFLPVLKIISEDKLFNSL